VGTEEAAAEALQLVPASHIQRAVWQRELVS
jgi:hypothetical protein